MRKKVILTIIAVAIASSSLIGVCLSSCSAKDKVLVTYFSATGTTRTLAEELAAATGADIFEIEGVQPYSDADVDFRNRESRSVKEMADKSIRPEIKSKPKKINRYDVVYIGFPIWGNAAPNIIYTFIEQNDLKDKRVITFSTSGSSELSNSHRLLKEQYPGLNWVEGVTLKRNPTPEDRQNVINKLKEAALIK